MLSTRLVLSLFVTALLIGTVDVAIAGPGHDHDHGPIAKIDHPAPDFTLTGIDGKDHSLSGFKGKYVVLEWNNPDCPFVKKHYGSGNMQALQEKYAKKDVVWLTICSSGMGKQGYYEPADLVQMTRKNESKATAYLRDSEGKVGRMYGAKTTPHMYVINPEGLLIYAGAIDNKPSTKTADVDGATNYVQSTLDAAMAGTAIPVKTTTPYGCSVKYPPSQGH